MNEKKRIVIDPFTSLPHLLIEKKEVRVERRGGGSNGAAISSTDDLAEGSTNLYSQWEVNTYGAETFVQPKSDNNGLVIGNDLHSSIVTGFANAAAHFNGSPDGQSTGTTYYVLESYGSSGLPLGSLYTSFRAGGTAASPSQTAAGSFIGGHVFGGLGTSGVVLNGATHLIPGFWVQAATTFTNTIAEYDMWLGGLTTKMIGYETDTNAIKFNEAMLDSDITFYYDTGTAGRFDGASGTLLMRAGDASNPSYGFYDNTDTGFYYQGPFFSPTFVHTVIDGTSRFQVTEDSIRVRDGSATAPSITFIGSQTAGLYYGGASIVGVLGDINFAKETARTIKIADSTTAATAGAALSIVGAAGSSTTSGNGGAVSITAGAAQAGNSGGGAASLIGGAGQGIGAGGAVTITGGSGGNGGNVSINAGNGINDGQIRIGSTDGLVALGHANSPSAHLDIRSRVATTDALSVDNVGVVANIAVFKDNGTAVWTIADGGNLTAGEGINVVTGTTTGTKFGTATTQKIGFFNATPVVQQTGDIRTALQTLGLVATATYPRRTVTFIIDGGGSVITTGAKRLYASVPYSGTIRKWRILPLDGNTGSIVIDVWKDTYANFAPTVADTITASAKPTVSAATKAESSTLTGWTTAVTAGDIFEINIDSVSTFTKVKLELEIEPTS